MRRRNSAIRARRLAAEERAPIPRSGHSTYHMCAADFSQWLSAPCRLSREHATDQGQWHACGQCRVPEDGLGDAVLRTVCALRTPRPVDEGSWAYHSGDACFDLQSERVRIGRRRTRRWKTDSTEIAPLGGLDAAMRSADCHRLSSLKLKPPKSLLLNCRLDREADGPAWCAGQFGR